jgi:hypothetical protein
MEVAVTDNVTTEKAPAPEPVIAREPNSGYRRLRNRHRALIAEHEALRLEHQQVLADQAALQADVDRLLQEHARLIQSIKASRPTSWFASANEALAKLAAALEPMAIETMTVALAKLLQRVSTIRTGAPV